MTTVPANKPVAFGEGIGAPSGGAGRLLGLFTPAGAAMAGLLGLGFVALFFRWLYVQHLHSMGAMEDWGHAYLVPVFSGYLVWREREGLWRAGASAFWPGLAPFVLGIVSYFVCVALVRNHMLQGMSMILALFGLALLLLGPRAMRFVFLPIAFLVFGVTVSERILIEFTFPLQRIAAEGAYVLLSVIGAVGGFGVEIAGNTLTIITGSGKMLPALDVAQACSGMRMVIAFFALGGMVALLQCPRWWQRVSLMMMAAPVALGLNIVRVAVLGLVSLIDPNLAGGEAHTLIGTLLLIPGLGLFLLVVWVLRRIVPEAPAGGAA